MPALKSIESSACLEGFQKNFVQKQTSSAERDGYPCQIVAKCNFSLQNRFQAVAFHPFLIKQLPLARFALFAKF
jgi:hypothetical protein